MTSKENQNFQTLSLFVEGLELYKKQEREEQYNFIKQVKEMNTHEDEAVSKALKDFEYVLVEVDKILERSEEMTSFDLCTQLGPYFERMAQCHVLLTMLMGNYMGGSLDDLF